MNENLKNILSYVFVIVIAILIKEYVFSPIKVNGSSMYPTLNDGDIMILNEIGYYISGVNRFDIVVVRTDNERIIKRVIGLPGDKISYQDNILYINDIPVDEDFTHEITPDFELSKIGYDTIPDDYYFVLGDNRINSKDSRMIGLIHKSQIKGKTNFVVYPFTKIGTIN